MNWLELLVHDASESGSVDQKNPSMVYRVIPRREVAKKAIFCHGCLPFFLSKQEGELQMFHKLYFFLVAVNVCAFPKERGNAQGNRVFIF